MKITDVRVFVVTPPSGLNHVLVKVLTDEGLYGVGEGSLRGSDLAVAKVLEHMKPLLLGKDPHEIEDTWFFLYHHSYWRNGVIQKAALAAIDIALWDLKAKAAQMPLYQLLGGRCRKGILVYTHGKGRDFVEVEDDVRRYMEKGYKVMRAQLGEYYGGAGVLKIDEPTHEKLPGVIVFEPAKMMRETPKLFEHLRVHLGDEIELLHDVHEQLTPIETARLAQDLEPYRLFYLEDPVYLENTKGLRLIRAASTIPLAIGETFASRLECLPLFEEMLIDYIRITPVRVGGITEARKICALAEPYEIKTAFYGPGAISPVGQAAAIHLQLAVHNFGVQEWVDFNEMAGYPEMFEGICTFEDGYVNPSEAPGHGVDFNEEKIKKYGFEEHYLPLYRRRDGSAHRY